MDALNQRWREALARIEARSSEFMVEQPDASVDECVQLAIAEEAILNGVPGLRAPRGITGLSDIGGKG